MSFYGMALEKWTPNIIWNAGTESSTHNFTNVLHNCSKVF